MDIEGIQLVETSLAEFSGALVLISHDRDLLDSLCTKIIEIEGGKIKTYSGNYSEYIKQKTEERKLAQFEYEQYVKEKKRLERIIISTREKAKSMRKTPEGWVTLRLDSTRWAIKKQKLIWIALLRMWMQESSI